MSFKKLYLPLNFDDESIFWSLRESIFDSNCNKHENWVMHNKKLYDSYSLFELNSSFKNTPIISSVTTTNKIQDEWANFGEKYSGSVIDKFIFGKEIPVSFSKEVEPKNYRIKCDNLVTSNKEYQITNRIKGFVYLKKLWHSLINCKLNFWSESKWADMTPGEVDFIEDIHNLQNYMPASINALSSEEIHNCRKLTSPEFSAIGLKKPDLSKWKNNILKINHNQTENKKSSKKYKAPFDFVNSGWKAIKADNQTSEIKKSKLKAKKKTSSNKSCLLEIS